MAVQAPSGVLVDLRNFLSGWPLATSSKSRPSDTESKEVVRTATKLLKNFPAAREAVLYFFCQVIDKAIELHFAEIQAQNTKQNADTPASKKHLSDHHEAISLIHESLSSLIQWNPRGWAPAICTWSLKLLGQVSSYHARFILPVSDMREINTILPIWLGCPPAKMLIDLTTQSLENLNQSETGTCINALLETNVEHYPYFDWVVAHVGGCFPQTVVTRVLACGLHDFILYGFSEDPKSVSPKIQSAECILTYLSISHACNIEKAVFDLFTTSCVDMSEQHVAVVPYLLQLAILSPYLSDIILEQAVKAINDETLAGFSQQSSIWFSKHFGNKEAMMKMVARKVNSCRQGGYALISLLIAYGASKQPSFPRDVACQFTELLLNEASGIVQDMARVMPSDFAFFQSLQPHLQKMCNAICDYDTWQQGVSLRLFMLMAHIQGSAVSNQVVASLLQKGQTFKVVPLIRHFLKSVQGLHTNVIEASTHEVLTLQGSNLENALKNLIHLVCTENEAGAQLRCKFQTALQSSLNLFPALFFHGGQVPYLAVRLLNAMNMPELIQPRLLAKLIYCGVPHFFTAISTRGKTNQKEAQKLLSTASGYPSGQALILRLLMQGVFSEEWKSLFGADQPHIKAKPQPSSISTSLLTQNRNFCSSVTLPQRHSSVFHAGIIGNGIRNRHHADAKPETVHDFTEEEIRSNINLLLDTLSLCCSINTNGMTQLALLLVEIVSPDVMFNGLVWPDEEFIKVTVERDLHVRRFIQSHRVVWDLLTLLAHYRPALCYCSVLLRALLATLLSHWANCQLKQAKDSRQSLEITSRLIELMATGQLLPPPLSYISEVISHISPHEVHVLLKDIWAFMRDNVPSPTLFGGIDRPSPNIWRDLTDYKMDPRYTERLRLIMLANIASVGRLYPRFLGPNN